MKSVPLKSLYRPCRTLIHNVEHPAHLWCRQFLGRLPAYLVERANERYCPILARYELPVAAPDVVVSYRSILLNAVHVAVSFRNVPEYGTS